MNEVKFISFKATPGEKHIGIMTLALFDGKIYVRYKMSPGKTGGHFPNVPSYKVSENGQESYLAGFVVESSIMKEEIDTCIKNNMNRILASQSTSSNQSFPPPSPFAYNTPPPVMDNFPTGDCPF